MKFLAGAVLAICAVLISQYVVPAQATDGPTVQSLYDAYNAAYFNDQLPPILVVLQSPPPVGKEELEGETEHTVGSHWYKIFISPKYNITGDQQAETVLHEMCHVKVWEDAETSGVSYDGGHGAPWQGCMLGLAKQGAFASIW